ncbi:hypothetical protein [Terriglobus roseus]|uniref:Protease inhibitor Inh n=1 Tax=Terriglobus roseus TaxID=392734 RepID=A0A1H4QR23_9BACT|nr:hypothetical protein [Terriglobus roseus]SEC21992.1 hypothetical protein SAMN05443244_2940 [Terriglobus roseus]
MRWLRVMAACSLLAVSAGSQQPATSAVNGTWKLELALGDNPLPETCILHDDAPKLTGVCRMPAGEADILGEINGSDVQWKHSADVFGNPVAFSFVAKVKDDGTMAGTFGIDAFGVTQPFTATKVMPDAK